VSFAWLLCGQSLTLYRHSQGDQVYLKREVHDEAVLPLSALSRLGDDTPRHISSAASDRTHASDW
jgi:inositol hexakisphosphate/diphosphoinositol-pentakisphosphate kinase